MSRGLRVGGRALITGRSPRDFNPDSHRLVGKCVVVKQLAVDSCVCCGPLAAVELEASMPSVLVPGLHIGGAHVPHKYLMPLDGDEPRESLDTDIEREEALHA